MEYNAILVRNSKPLSGHISLSGSKNSILVIMASLLLVSGKSTLNNVPFLDDVFNMIVLLEELGAIVDIDYLNKSLSIDTSNVNLYSVRSEIMNKMRASILVLAPLLARFKNAKVALPGGCVIGARPIDFHLNALRQMNVQFDIKDSYILASTQSLKAARIALDYPSVGATENIIMASVLTKGKTTIMNASLEPEVYDLITILRKMGANITIYSPATIEIEGVDHLKPVCHSIINDRLEAGTILLAAAITNGSITINDAPWYYMDIFLDKLCQMGHSISIENGNIIFKATKNYLAVSCKTMPYPGFPTDLQAPMSALLSLSDGNSYVYETVFENRFLHAIELQKMGAKIDIFSNYLKIEGVDKLQGTKVIASDIRASASLVIAGLAAQGETLIMGIKHFKRGYDNLDKKLNSLGADISFINI